jgi:hypothetical protein
MNDKSVDPAVNLLIAVPTMGSVHPILASRLIEWGQAFPKGQISFYFTFKVSPVDRARNQVIEFFLAKKQFTHLLFIDSDTIPEPDAPFRLLARNMPIVSGMTPILSYTGDENGWATYDNCFIARNSDDNGKVIETVIASRNTGLQEIFRCGASCLLISREVAEKLEKPLFKFITNPAGTSHTKSEDIFFCDLAKAAGYQIFADTDVICQHYKDIML